MPYSSSQGKLFFEDWIRCFLPKTVLDIGAGAGVYVDIISRVFEDLPGGMWKLVWVDAVEIFEPYIEKFKLKEKYDKVFVRDVRDTEFLESLENYDLVIMGDLVEHLSREDMIRIWPFLKKKARFILISLPMKKGTFGEWYEGYNQDSSEWAENRYEKHVCDWEFEEITSCLGPFKWVVPFVTVTILVAEGDLCD